MAMDAGSDLALLEIAREDDSLLLQTENQNEKQACDNNLFLCSPLVAISRSKPRPPEDRNIPPSLLPETDGNVGTEDPGKSTCSSLNGGVSKEKVMNDNKMEAQKLSLEPQKMKRKKKGGGYNLRKSLAWDRAFFTEEGVLNSLELSMISCDQSMPGEKGMSVIHEEEGESSVLHSIEENLFKQLSASTSSEHGNDSVQRLPKRQLSAGSGVAPGSAVKRKVLGVREINRSGSKHSGGPRPVTSSSPAIMKVPSKDSKVTKTSVPKPNCTFTSASTTSKDTPNGVSKRNQNVHPIAALQKTSGPKVPLNNPTSVAPNTKNVSANTFSGARTSTVKIIKPLTKTESQKQLLVSKAKNGVDVIHEKQVTPGPMLSYPGCPKDSVSGSGKIPGYNSQNASCSLNNLQNVQLQTLKPSGLRMPSPSLGFFEQAKPTPSHSLIQKSTLPCNLLESKTPIMRKVGASNCIGGLKPPLPPQRKPEIEKTIPLRSNLSEGKLNSRAKTNREKSEMKLKKVSTNSGKESRQGQLYTTSDFTFANVQDHADENTSSIEDSESQADGGRFLFDSETSEKLVDVDANGGNADNYHKSIDLRSVGLEGSKVTCSHSPATQLSGGSKICYLKTGLPDGKVDYLSNITPRIHNLESVDAHHGEHRAIQMNDVTSNYVHDANRQQPGAKIQLVNAFLREIDQTSGGNMMPSTNNVTLIEEGNVIAQALEAVSHGQLQKASGGNSVVSAVAHEHKTQPSEQVEQKEPFTCQVVETFNKRQAQQLCLSNSLNEVGSSVVLHDIVCMGEVREGCENKLQGPCMESLSKNSEEARDDSNGLDDDIAIDRECAEFCSLNRNMSFDDSKILNESAEVNEIALAFDDMKYEHADEVEISDVHFQRDTSERDDYKSGLNRYRAEESTHPIRSVWLCMPQSDGPCGAEQESLGASSPSISQFRDSILQMAVMMVSSQPLTEGQSSSIREIEVAEYDQSLPKYYQLQPQLTSLHSAGTGEDCTEKNTDMESNTSHPHPIVQATSLTKRNYMSDPEDQPDQEKLLSCETDKTTGEKDEDTAASSLVPKLGGNNETQIRHHNFANYNETSIASDLAPVVNEVTEVVTGNLSEHCAVHNDQISSQRTPGSGEACEEKGQIISEEAKTDVNHYTENCDSDMFHAGDGDKSKLDESGNKSKLEPLSIKPPKNAIPFSDEWLAAFEAAGEEVLTLKCGAVQNSPPDKPHHEPGPWSPVKRKNQVIGPYDCTKYTNIPPSTSQ